MKNTYTVDDRRLHRVAGGSMAPFLKKGDLLRWVPCAADDLQVGQLAVVRDGDRLLAHRVIAKNEVAVVTMGDGNLRAETVPRSSLLGRVVQVRRQALLMEFDIDADRERLRRLAHGLNERNRWHGRGTWGKRVAWLHRLLTRRALLRHARSSVRPTTLRETPELRAAVLSVFRELAGTGPSIVSVPSEDLIEALARHGLDVLEARKAGRSDRLRAAAVEYLAARSSIHAIVPALAERGIPSIVLKGIPLSTALYGGDPVRPSADLDLFVSSQDRERASRVLVEQGWRPTVGAGIGSVLHRLHFHEAFVPSGSMRVPVELHWRLEDRANLHRIEERGIWERQVVREGAGCLSPGDEFLYLCLHAARHALGHAEGLDHGAPAEWFVASVKGGRLIWYLDLHRHLHLYGASQDWPELARRIDRWNIGDDVATVLRVLDRLLPDSVAGDALNRLGISKAGSAAVSTTCAIESDPLAAQEAAMPGLIVRVGRLAGLSSLLFPAPQRLLRYHRASPAWLPALYLWHPVHMALRLAGLTL